MLPWLGFLTVVLLSAGLVWGLLLAPSDYQQGQSVRIMYVHVPAAILAQSSYVMMAVAALVALVWRLKIADAAVQTAAPIGAMMTLLALATGSLWGKPMWGTWWVWDARLTSMFILMIFYILYIVSLKLSSISLKVSSIIAIIGAINIPIIKYSVEWWNTLHQPASVKLGAASSIHPTMMTPLMLMLLVLLLYCALIFLMKYKTEIIRIKKDKINKL